MTQSLASLASTSVPLFLPKVIRKTTVPLAASTLVISAKCCLADAAVATTSASATASRPLCMATFLHGRARGVSISGTGEQCSRGQPIDKRRTGRWYRRARKRTIAPGEPPRGCVRLASWRPPMDLSHILPALGFLLPVLALWPLERLFPAHRDQP